MKKIVVPDGMKHSVGLFWPTPPEQFVIDRILESALRWLSENPIVPTDEQVQKYPLNQWHGPMIKSAFGEWMKIMFLAPEPEVPEAIKDLLDHWNDNSTPNHAQEDIIEAYNRGRKESK